jgi:hypothetical protein
VGRLDEAAAHVGRSPQRGDPEAIDVLQTAFRQAERRDAHREALTILGALVDILPADDERWLDVAEAMSARGGWVYRGERDAVGMRRSWVERSKSWPDRTVVPTQTRRRRLWNRPPASSMPVARCGGGTARSNC